MKYLLALLLAITVCPVQAQFARVYSDVEDHPELISRGSGSLIDSTLLVTAYHCTHDGFLTAEFGDQSIVGKVISADESSDIALVRLAEKPEGVVPVTLGVANVGEKVWLCGFGGPQDDWAVQESQLFGKGQNKKGGLQSFVHGIRPRQGDSGGPVLNARGDLVGVVTSMSHPDEEEAYGFFFEPMHFIAHSGVRKKARWDHVWEVDPYSIVHVAIRERIEGMIRELKYKQYLKDNLLPIPDFDAMEDK